MMDNEIMECPASDKITNNIAEAEKDPSKPKKKRSAKSYALSFFIKVFVTALVLFVIFKFFAGIY